jgi:hypothetical protein
LIAWKNQRWQIKDNAHSYFAFPVLFLVSFVVLLGVATLSIMRSRVRKTSLLLNIKFAHKLLAYSIIICGNLAIATGIYEYRTNLNHPNSFPFEWISIFLFVFILTTIEI